MRFGSPRVNRLLEINERVLAHKRSAALHEKASLEYLSYGNVHAAEVHLRAAKEDRDAAKQWRKMIHRWWKSRSR
jgi:hypothetical protein